MFLIYLQVHGILKDLVHKAINETVVGSLTLL